MNNEPKVALVVGTGSSGAKLIEAMGRKAFPPHDPAPVIPQPVITGPHGKAWRGDLDELRRTVNTPAHEDATIGFWIIEARWAHPVWHSYAITLVHLRPMADGRETIFYVEDATHELWLTALQPDADRDRVVRGLDPVMQASLSPLNFGAQIVEPDDAAPVLRIERAIQEIADGVLSPDTDFISQWVERFGRGMLKGAK